MRPKHNLRARQDIQPAGSPHTLDRAEWGERSLLLPSPPILEEPPRTLPNLPHGLSPPHTLCWAARGAGAWERIYPPSHRPPRASYPISQAPSRAPPQPNLCVGDSLIADVSNARPSSESSVTPSPSSGANSILIFKRMFWSCIMAQTTPIRIHSHKSVKCILAPVSGSGISQECLSWWKNGRVCNKHTYIFWLPPRKERWYLILMGFNRVF